MAVADEHGAVQECKAGSFSSNPRRATSFSNSEVLEQDCLLSVSLLPLSSSVNAKCRSPRTESKLNDHTVGVVEGASDDTASWLVQLSSRMLLLMVLLHRCNAVVPRHQFW